MDTRRTNYPYFVDACLDKISSVTGSLRRSPSLRSISVRQPYIVDAASGQNAVLHGTHLDKIGRPTHETRSSPICPTAVHRCHRAGQNPVLRGRLCWTKKQHTDLSTAPALGFVQTVLRGRSAVHHSVRAVHRSVHAVHRCQKYPATLGIHCGSRAQNFYKT